ncbi:MAG: DUF2326 domain-containing protein [Candidatus Hatepunaea meridiana]|nr:DUF2326 domain-containing protein [Candidatus Hatepunaea meridiana]
MKLSKLYSNKPEVFPPIKFLPGLNVILAEIRLPEKQEEDTHNLGKTILGSLIDFCLLAGKDKSFFLFKHLDRFSDFVFYLEVELLEGSYITIRRGVENATKIDFRRHDKEKQDFSDLPDMSWDHLSVPFKRACELLDSILNLSDLKPWKYRKIAGYLLRTQEDFSDVFQLKKFKGKHSDWKPFLAHLIGFNYQNLKDHYEREDELNAKLSEEIINKNELGGSVKDISKIENILLLKQNDAEKKQRLLDQFDFKQIDKEKTKLIVDKLDAEINQFNAERYSISHNIRKISNSLAAERLLFTSSKAEALFEEAGIVFAGQILKDFDQLIEFNRAITVERSRYLEEELGELKAELKKTNAKLNELNTIRTESLSYLSDSDVFDKYRFISDELITLKSEISLLNIKRKHLHRLQELRAQIRNIKRAKEELQIEIENDVEKQNREKASQFSSLRIYFNDIVVKVINQQATLETPINKEGHLEFIPEINDESEKATSAGSGHSYKKLLCVAFDLSLLRIHLDGNYPRFVFHDGLFESWDDRKKENLLEVIREYSDLGIQHIITLIDSDLPDKSTNLDPFFKDSEIVLRLHDEGDSGRLFKMGSW